MVWLDHMKTEGAVETGLETNGVGGDKASNT